MTSLNAAKDLAKSMIGLRDATAVQSKVFEFQNLLLDAQARAFAAQEERTTLIQKIAELEKKIASLKDWETEKQRYELKGVGFGHGAMVYQLQMDVEGTEQPHCICANCYEDSVKSILQCDRAGGSTYLICPRCKTSLLTGGHGSRRP